jgi:hypothetical protein
MGARGVEEIEQEGVNLCKAPEDRKKEAGSRCFFKKEDNTTYPVCPEKQGKDVHCDGKEQSCQSANGRCACNLGRFFCATQSNPVSICV